VHVEQLPSLCRAQVKAIQRRPQLGGLMADTNHTLSSRIMRLHLALRDTGGSVAIRDTAAREDSNTDVLTAFTATSLP
jgi:hypothetical protein